MLIRLSEINDEPFQWAKTRTIDASLLESDQLVGLGPISWTGEVSRTSTGFLLRGRLEYEQQLACPRCLKPTPMSVVSDVELLVEARSNEPTIGEIELEEEDLDVLYVEGEELDTEPILVEQLQLNIPMRRLCREDCRGLCPACGVDLNEETCQCERTETDPRWAALEKLRGE